MPWYEIVYETGNHSVAFYGSDDEANVALNAHQERARSGETATPQSTERTDIGAIPSAPTSWPAERIAKVYKYDDHPANFGIGEQVPIGDLSATLESAQTEQGLVSVPVAAAAIRAASSPLTTPQGPHDSMYAMEHTELAWENN